MIIRLKWIGYLLAMNLILGRPINMLTNAYAQGQEESLDWSIETAKETFYPGEPVLLTLKITNTGKQEEEIDFGADGIEAFSMQIRGRSNKIVAKGGKIQRFGVSRLGTLVVAPGKTGKKLIVLNQWCSTLLPPGQYHIICNVGYRLESETRNHKAGPLHPIELELDINVVEMDDSGFKKILEDLAERAFKRNVRTRSGLEDVWISKEMLTFAESDMAVPYQLKLVKNATTTWMKWDAINSLVRSETLGAANGLMQIIEDCPQCGIEDVKRQVIDAVYRLRETGKSDIINATDEFVAKYKRPVLGNKGS